MSTIFETCRRWRAGMVAGAVVFGAYASGLGGLTGTDIAAAAQPAVAGDLGFELPAGYTQQRKDNLIILAPANTDRTPCIYGFAGRMPASSSLEADAEAALKLVMTGFRRLDDRHYVMKGTSAFGWSYVWRRAAFQGDSGGQRQSVNAMAMVLPAGGGQVHVVWGMGSIARCLLDDAAFEELFHGLRPQGWTSDGGQALTRALMGTWRFNTGAGGMHQLTFGPGGRFDRDLGSSATVGVSERTSSTAAGGRFTLRDGELSLAQDSRSGSPDRYLVRVYQEFSSIGWKDSAVLFNSRDKLVVQYYRVGP